VLAYESGVADVVDPLAGSYFVESLTEQTEAAAWRYIEQIDALDGALRAIERGFIQAEIQESAYRFQQEVERGDRAIVGVNRFADERAGLTAEILRVDPAVRDRQIARIQAVKARRDERRARAALMALDAAARSSENTMPRILACIEALCTLGEISETLRGVFGEAAEVSTL
jgi:methylmalonyl-CoA mutase N-terminal domain/subunit